MTMICCCCWFSEELRQRGKKFGDCYDELIESGYVMGICAGDVQY